MKRRCLRPSVDRLEGRAAASAMAIGPIPINTTLDPVGLPPAGPPLEVVPPPAVPVGTFPAPVVGLC